MISLWKEKLKMDEHTICVCNKMPHLTHELSQSLMIINAHVNGCSEPLKEKKLDLNQLPQILNKIDKHLEIMGNKIHYFR